MAERRVIGEGTCADCGATVELRVNKGGRVYSHCDGVADDKGRACNAAVTYSKTTSTKMIAEATHDPEGDDDEGGTETTRTAPEGTGIRDRRDIARASGRRGFGRRDGGSLYDQL